MAGTKGGGAVAVMEEEGELVSCGESEVDEKSEGTKL